MSTGDRNALSMLGEQAKDSASSASAQSRLLTYLYGLPSLAFTDKGRTHICQRFGAQASDLDAAVATLEARPGQPTHALLRIIATAVGHQAEGGASQC
jgi:hypothetical protein